MKSNSRLMICCLGTILSAVIASPVFASHPFHVSAAEVHWNESSGNFEIAICVWPADLEKAIARQQARSIDLDKIEDLDALMKQYVASRFAIRESGPLNHRSRQTIRWVGHQLDLKNAWLFFEIDGSLQPDSWQIENRIFFELNEDQINQVQLSVGGTPESTALNISKPQLEFKTQIRSTRDSILAN